jgi:uncharacterized protein
VRDGRAGSQAVVDLLDLHEGRLGMPLLDDAGVRRLLASGPRIAIVGASSDPGRPSNGVLRELHAAGFDVIPVNPNVTLVDGLRCYPSVMDAVAATGPIDIVDVFRRPEVCADAARQAIESGARCLWLQLGIANREAGLLAHHAGLLVVMDRCTIIEARRAGLA